jgi:hypothetical protein
MIWKLHNIGGTPAETLASVKGDNSLPVSAKAYITDAITTLPPEAKLCRLDAYCQDVPSPRERKTLRNIQISLVWWA